MTPSNETAAVAGVSKFFAHSQGTKTFQRALSFIKPEARKLICYTGIGGETRIRQTDGERGKLSEHLRPGSLCTIRKSTQLPTHPS